MKRFDPSRRVPRCSCNEIFSPKKKTKQNVNVSMCYLVSDGDGFILVFFFLGGGKGRLGGDRGFLYIFVDGNSYATKKSMNKLVMISSRLSMGSTPEDVLIGTDVASKGLDFPAIQHVPGM